MLRVIYVPPGRFFAAATVSFAGDFNYRIKDAVFATVLCAGMVLQPLRTMTYSAVSYVV